MDEDFMDFVGGLTQGQFGADNGVAWFKGIGENPDRPLHHYWIAVAIHAAHSTTDEDFPEDWYELKTEVFIRRKNPGWIDGFRISTGSGG